jgi:phage terminase large subunit
MVFLELKRRRIVADSQELKTIEEFKKERGFNIIPCIKGPGSVNAGINWMKDFKLFVHKNSHNLKNELLNYQYIIVGGESTNEPIDDFNHLIDAARYTKALYKKSTGLNISFHR